MKLLATLLVLWPVALWAKSVTIAWDPNPPGEDVAGYIIRWSTVSGEYDLGFNVTNTTATIHNLSEGVMYYFVVTAYNHQGLEGPMSQELGYLIPSNVIQWTNVAPGIVFYTDKLGFFWTNPTNINEVAVAISGSINTNWTQAISGFTNVFTPGQYLVKVTPKSTNTFYSSYMFSEVVIPSPNSLLFSDQVQIASSPDGPWTNFVTVQVVLPYQMTNLFLKTMVDASSVAIQEGSGGSVNVMPPRPPGL